MTVMTPHPHGTITEGTTGVHETEVDTWNP